MPLVARIVAVLFAIAGVLAIVTIPLCWWRLGANAAAGYITAEQEAAGRMLLCVTWGALAGIYGGAAWMIWTGKLWRFAMLFSIGALFGFPLGTVLGIVSIVVLRKKNVRANFQT